MRTKTSRRWAVSSETRDAARNLVVAGGSLLLAALAACLPLWWIVPAGSIIYWMLGSLMVLGAAALASGALAYAYALIFGSNDAARTRENA